MLHPLGGRDHGGIPDFSFFRFLHYLRPLLEKPFHAVTTLALGTVPENFEESSPGVQHGGEFLGDDSRKPFI